MASNNHTDIHLNRVFDLNLSPTILFILLTYHNAINMLPKFSPTTDPKLNNIYQKITKTRQGVQIFIEQKMQSLNAIRTANILLQGPDGLMGALGNIGQTIHIGDDKRVEIISSEQKGGANSNMISIFIIIILLIYAAQLGASSDQSKSLAPIQADQSKSLAPIQADQSKSLVYGKNIQPTAHPHVLIPENKNALNIFGIMISKYISLSPSQMTTIIQTLNANLHEHSLGIESTCLTTINNIVEQFPTKFSMEEAHNQVIKILDEHDRQAKINNDKLFQLATGVGGGLLLGDATTVLTSIAHYTTPEETSSFEKFSKKHPPPTLRQSAASASIFPNVRTVCKQGSMLGIEYKSPNSENDYTGSLYTKGTSPEQADQLLNDLDTIISNIAVIRASKPTEEITKQLDIAQNHIIFYGEIINYYQQLMSTFAETVVMGGDVHNINVETALKNWAMTADSTLTDYKENFKSHNPTVSRNIDHDTWVFESQKEVNKKINALNEAETKAVIDAVYANIGNVVNPVVKGATGFVANTGSDLIVGFIDVIQQTVDKSIKQLMGTVGGKMLLVMTSATFLFLLSITVGAVTKFVLPGGIVGFAVYRGKQVLVWASKTCRDGSNCMLQYLGLWKPTVTTAAPAAALTLPNTMSQALTVVGSKGGRRTRRVRKPKSKYKSNKKLKTRRTNKKTKKQKRNKR